MLLRLCREGSKPAEKHTAGALPVQPVQGAVRVLPVLTLTPVSVGRSIVAPQLLTVTLSSKHTYIHMKLSSQGRLTSKDGR